jgi:hypothetical protein
MSTLLIFVISLLACVQISTSVICYQCEASDAGCDNPKNSTNLPTCVGKQCASVAASAAGHTGTKRQCLNETVESDGCKSTSFWIFSGKGCLCSTDYCNTDIISGSESSIYRYTRQMYPVLMILSMLALFLQRY